MTEKKRSKYDTNPLDTDYAERADDEWGARRRAEPATKTEERWPAEAPTKRYDGSIPVSYPSINVPPSYPPKPAGATAEMKSAESAPSPTRAVPGLGLPENFTYALPYAPFFIGAIGAAVELFLTPRSEPRARFHAAQGMVLQLAALAITTLLNIVGDITGSTVGSKLFWAASTVLFIVATVRVFKGESFHIAAADDAADWINRRIEPQSKKK